MLPVVSHIVQFQQKKKKDCDPGELDTDENKMEKKNKRNKGL